MSTDRVKHHCGLFGVVGRADASTLTFHGLYAQQHRGQESAGICVSDGETLRNETGMGLVTEVFDRRRLHPLTGDIAIGHVRYSTTGTCSHANAQPLLIRYAGGQVAVAHNGNLVNAAKLREGYERRGAIFQTTSDTEVIVHLLADPRYSETDDPLAEVLRQLRGAYCLLFLFPDRIEAARDPYGLRPLCIGRMADGSHVVASETCGLDMVDAAYERDVAPGEIVTLMRSGTGVSCGTGVSPVADRRDAGPTKNAGPTGAIRSRRFANVGGVLDPDSPGRPAHCIFEQVYFADPSSNVFGQNVHLFRVATGRQLALESHVDADMVIAVPNCARCAAQGYGEQSGVPVGRGFTTSHYAGRSFILPTQDMRDIAVKRKLNVIKESVAGKRLIVVEDSVVRGTTTRGKMGALRKAGAKEIHLRVASPPIRDACYFGIDFPDRKELIATGRSVDDIREYLGVDSLAYLSLDGMLACARHAAGDYCTACFSGRMPMRVDDPPGKLVMERPQAAMPQRTGA